MREHLRSNVVGYIALFCFAMAGTAGALPGSNSVNSGDIRDGKVKLQDLGTDSVDSSKVVDDSLGGADVEESSLAAGGDLAGSVGAATIANNTIGLSEPGGGAEDEINDGTVDSEDVANDSLVASDIADNGSIGEKELADVSNRRIEFPVSVIGAAALQDPASGPTVVAPTGLAPRLQFSATNDDAVNLAVQIPQDRVAGTSVFVVLRWSGSGTGDVQWAVDAASVGVGQAVNASPATIIPSGASTGTAGTLHSISFDIDAVPSLDNQDTLMLRVYRDADNASDDNPSAAFLYDIAVLYTSNR